MPDSNLPMRSNKPCAAKIRTLESNPSRLSSMTNFPHLRWTSKGYWYFMLQATERHRGTVMDYIGFLSRIGWKKIREQVWGSPSSPIQKTYCPGCGNALPSAQEEMCLDCKLHIILGKNAAKSSTREERRPPHLSDLEKAYQFLELKPSVQTECVKQRYRELIKHCHPDTIKDGTLEKRQQAADLFREIDKAFKLILKIRNGR